MRRDKSYRKSSLLFVCLRGQKLNNQFLPWFQTTTSRQCLQVFLRGQRPSDYFVSNSLRVSNHISYTMALFLRPPASKVHLTDYLTHSYLTKILLRDDGLHQRYPLDARLTLWRKQRRQTRYTSSRQALKIPDSPASTKLPRIWRISSLVDGRAKAFRQGHSIRSSGSRAWRIRGWILLAG